MNRARAAWLGLVLALGVGQGWAQTSGENRLPEVRLFAPLDGAVFVAPAHLLVGAQAVDPDGEVVTVEFFANGRSLGVRTNLPVMNPLGPFLLEWDGVEAGGYELVAQAVDNQGGVGKSGVVRITVEGGGVPGALVTRGAVWKLRDDGVDLGTAWREAGYDDSAWKSGPAQLGFGDGDERTLLNSGPREAHFPTYYFRRRFGVEDAAGIKDLTVRLLRDDGGVVYLNGVEIFRSNLPAGGITFGTLATSAVTWDAESVFHAAAVEPGLLREGENVLAVEVHQASVESSDLSFDLELVGGRSELPVVTVEATDAAGREIPLVPPWLDILQETDPVVFTVRRTGPTASPLTVFYGLGGTALRGVDFVTEPAPSPQGHPGVLVIPSGAASAQVTCWVTDDGLVEPDESVVMELVGSPVMGDPGGLPGYRVGDPRVGRGVIRSDDLVPNLPPAVRWESPAGGAVFEAGAVVRLVVKAEDSDGWVQRVEFLANERRLGTVENAGPGQPFVFEWSGVAPGDYGLRARAVDSTGGVTVSEAVRISVRAPVLPTVVNVFARDPEGAELNPALAIPPNPAVFEVRRDGGTNVALKVHYDVSGTAGNGVDYVKLDGVVVIPEGRWSTELRVEVLDDLLPEAMETVVITLVAPACPAIYPPPPECYNTGGHPRDVAFLRDDDSPPPNQLPRVRWLRPSAGATWAAPAEIPLAVEVMDPDGWVGWVEFLANGRKVAEQRVVFIQEPPPGQTQTFTATWSGVPPGDYLLTARVHDNREGIGMAEPMWVRVSGDDGAVARVSVMAVDPWAREGTDAAGGLNEAVFALRRTGDTNQDLTVFYSLSGLAENGVDYQKLPGTVTIPAGRRSVRVVVTPVDDDLPEQLEPVVLKVEPDPTLGPVPRYVAGMPGRAGAVVVDNDQPRPGSCRLPGGLFHLNLPVTGSTAFRVEGSQDLVNWQVLGLVTPAEGAAGFVDPESPNHGMRFYRVIAEPSVAIDE